MCEPIIVKRVRSARSIKHIEIDLQKRYILGAQKVSVPLDCGGGELLRKGGYMTVRVCRVCGQPIRPKYSFTEKLVKDLVYFSWLIVKSTLIASFGIVIGLWYIVLPKLGDVIVKIGVKAVRLGYSLQKRN